MLYPHGTSEVHLYTNLVECSALGVRAFEEADEKMAKLAKTITDITEHGGIVRPPSGACWMALTGSYIDR